MTKPPLVKSPVGWAPLNNIFQSKIQTKSPKIRVFKWDQGGFYLWFPFMGDTQETIYLWEGFFNGGPPYIWDTADTLKELISWMNEDNEEDGNLTEITDERHKKSVFENFRLVVKIEIGGGTLVSSKMKKALNLESKP